LCNYYCGHPDHEKQVNELFTTLNQSITCSSIRPIQGEGFNKAPFWLQATSSTGLTTEYVLMLCRDYEGRQTKNIVNVLNFVKKNTTIPVPTIFASGTDSSSSPFGCAFVLMEAMKGQKIKYLLPSLDLQKKRTLAIHLAGILVQMQKLKFSCIGGFSSPLEPDLLLPSIIPLFHFPETVQAARFFDISQGPFQTPWEFYSSVFLTYSHLLRSHSNPRAKTVGEFCTIFVEKVLLKKKNSTDIETFGLNHGDFGDDNIFCDPETGVVTAVLDWDGSFAGPVRCELCALQKLFCGKMTKKKDQEGYDEQFELVQLFEKCVIESNGTLRSQGSEGISECSWLARLTNAIVGWRGWFPLGPQDDARAEAFLEKQLDWAQGHIRSLNEKYKLNFSGIDELR